MKRIPQLALSLAVLALVGCHSDDHHEKKMAMKDMCKHCAGDQDMTAMGTCEGCGMVVDCCAMCSGDQKLTSDGRCPGCGMKVETAG